MNRREAIVTVMALAGSAGALKADSRRVKATDHTALLVTDRGRCLQVKEIDPTGTCVKGYQSRSPYTGWIGSSPLKPLHLDARNVLLYVFTGYMDADGRRIFTVLNSCPLCGESVVGSIETSADGKKYYACGGGHPVSLMTWPFKAEDYHA